ncbi:MAG: AMP-binding protein, partial [Candidatus Celaenobacter antarcticus]|nr:AMP-binding protein [Candidatus Celaenobacter antarcticus]
KENFIDYIEKGIKENWDLNAFTNYRGDTLTYRQTAIEILKLHHIFKALDLKKGAKIAVLGKNSTNWAITYLAAVTYGAVIVPILPDFKADDFHHILNHSDSEMLFVGDGLYEDIDESKIPNIDVIFAIEDFSILYQKHKSLKENITKAAIQWDTELVKKLKPNSFTFEKIANDKLAAIVYTSGTTGFSKGVMLSHNSLIGNVVYAHEHMPLKAGERILSFLPLAHAYGCAFEFLFPFTLGCHITFLTKLPSPKIILKGFADVKPHLILSVPLIIEKIYRKQVKPVLDKGSMKILLSLPGLKSVIKNKIKKKLVTAFGDNFYEVVIGGAALNEEAEAFFQSIKFPFTIGYGMTECGPLVSYANWKIHKAASCGQTINFLEAKIDSDDPQNIVGEILVRGEVVMDGYYKNEEATSAAIDDDGWLHTGDLGLIDKDNFIFIKGRAKSLILSSSGQNIYPEELEAKINNLPYIQESLVIEKNGKLVALVYANMDKIDAEHISEAKVEELMEQNRKNINQILPAYSSISKFELYPEEFEKTPTKKIKRFIYAV